jgi:hypothetical protein
MDEICTARNAAQRRCACAGRVRAFAEAELNLEKSNEELIKVSGELALLIATKGKDVSSAFQLTDAERVMNCVSYRDAKKDGTWTEEEATEWCTSHGIYQDAATCPEPKYCKATGNSFGFDIVDLDGNSSDIYASIVAWAKAKDETFTIYKQDNDNLGTIASIMGGVVNDMSGLGNVFAQPDELKDSLAETWGYELFEYAHNNICSRVLDSCFNGIYEACGTPGTGGRKCANGAAQCPFNYNSQITVNNTTTYEPNFIKPGASVGTATNSASCFGYTGSAGDPYSNLRTPAADGRRSIMQKYVMDANADCDAYGEQLRTTAQNIGYQKVAAQQALQRKRLEFVQEAEKETLAATNAASTNFSQCISELYECYEAQCDANEDRDGGKWQPNRIKTYCATIANAPSCYQDMICIPSESHYKAVIDVPDSDKCDPLLSASTPGQAACRNVVTLYEILNSAHPEPRGTATDSAWLREGCLGKAIGSGTESLRGWTCSK